MNKCLPLTAIFGLGLFIRMIGLGGTPVGFTWDEAALGYNAFSLSQTGKDEWGVFAPLIFRSFDDYKPGLYVYLALPAIVLFGLSEFATRLPSAILGSLSTLLVYLLAMSLNFSKSSKKPIALAAAFLWSINPWLIFFSRGAWEANVWVFLSLLGLTLWMRERPIISSAVFALSLLNYQGAKLLTPLVLASLFIFTRGRLSRRRLLACLAVFLAISLPVLLSFPTSSGRLRVFSMFSYSRDPQAIQNIRAADSNLSYPHLWFHLFHSEGLNYLRGFCERFLNHLSPKFLFTDGDWSSQRHGVPFHGNFYLFEIVTIAVGAFTLINLFKFRLSIFLFGLILASILPSALSRDIVSGLRSLPLAIPITIISGIGLAKIFSKRLLALPAMLIIFASLTYFLDLLFTQSKYYSSSAWLSVMNPVYQKIQQLKDDYHQVVVSDRLGQPYIFALFYHQIHPVNFVDSKKTTPSPVGDASQVNSFANFAFRPVYWPADRGSSSTLFAAAAEELPEKDILSTPNAIWYADIVSPDRLTVFRIVGKK